MGKKKAKAKKAKTKKAKTKKAKKVMGEPTGPKQVRRGDLIAIDSPQVGSPAREGEVLKVIQGAVGVSYRVRWSDGHETLIAPGAGSVKIART